MRIILARDSNVEIFDRRKRKGHELLKLPKRRTLGHIMRKTEHHHYRKLERDKKVIQNG